MRETRCELLMILFSALIWTEVSSVYKEYLLENADVCSPTTKKRLKIGSEEKSGIYLTQKRLGDHKIDWNVPSSCSFEIKAESYERNKRDGIFAVIQSLDLRQDESGKCIDYIRYKTKDGKYSDKFCGIINAGSDMDKYEEQESDEVQGPFPRSSFDDPFGELDVYIYVNKTALMPYQKTEINIVFTSYRPCSISAGYFACRDTSKCIYTSFFNDHYYNCPYACIDETDCDGHYRSDNDNDYKHESIGNKVLISSLTSLIVIFIVFICCVTMCRKYGAVCWSDEFARPSSTNNVSQQAVQVAPQSTERVESAEATAPLPDDKDLPPTYESLFPSR